MRLLVSADETGNIKEVYTSRGVDTSIKGGKQPNLVQNFLQQGDNTNVRHRVACFKQYKHNWLIAARLSGYVTIYDLASESAECELLHTYQLPVEALDRPISIVNFEDHDFTMVAFESGSVFVIYFKEDGFLFEPLQLKLRQNPDEPKPLGDFVAHPTSFGVFACGGKKSDLQVIRLFGARKKFKEADFSTPENWTPKILFEAENVEPDHLGIECPIAISKILFQKSKKGYRLVTATRTGHIRTYDSNEDTEPTGSYKVCDKAILTLKFATSDEESIIISDQHTFVVRLSLVEIDAKAQKIVSASAGTFWKPSLKLLGKYSEGGNTGAINGVDVSHDANIVAFGGLDRYLRVFDITSRKLLSKVYLGTQISCLEIMDDEDDEEDTEESQETKEEKEFWDKLEEPEPKKRKVE